MCRTIEFSNAWPRKSLRFERAPRVSAHSATARSQAPAAGLDAAQCRPWNQAARLAVFQMNVAWCG